jgi:hypothetical protein
MVVLYIVISVVSLAVLYGVIRLATTHALRSHSIWVHEDGVALAIAKRNAAQAD